MRGNVMSSTGGANRIIAAVLRVDALRGGVHFLGMTIIAQELDRRLQTLDATRAARCEQLVRALLALFDEQPTPALSLRKAYRTRTHRSGLLPGVDPTKLGQWADDL